MVLGICFQLFPIFSWQQFSSYASNCIYKHYLEKMIQERGLRYFEVGIWSALPKRISHKILQKSFSWLYLSIFRQRFLPWNPQLRPLIVTRVQKSTHLWLVAWSNHPFLNWISRQELWVREPRWKGLCTELLLISALWYQSSVPPYQETEPQLVD